MKKAVIFDMDGVLIDSENFYFKRRMAFFNGIEVEPAMSNLKDFVGLSDRMIWERLVPGDKDKRTILKAEYVKFREKHKIKFKEVLNPSVKYTMVKLKERNIKIGIASSSEKKEIARMMKECNLEEYIDFYISGEDCTESKPSPEIYNRTLDALNISSKEAIAVEDSTLGIESAVLAQIDVVALIQEECNIDQSKANYKIKDLKEIIELI